MNPLAELHERLAYSAVAGTALLEEDFRLKKMVDTFASLAPEEESGVCKDSQRAGRVI